MTSMFLYLEVANNSSKCVNAAKLMCIRKEGGVQLEYFTSICEWNRTLCAAVH